MLFGYLWTAGHRAMLRHNLSTYILFSQIFHEISYQGDDLVVTNSKSLAKPFLT